MFVGITNTPRDYAWGSHGAISALLGMPATTATEAELWLGAHPGSPSRIIHPEQAGGAATLADWIAADPEETLGSRPAGEPRLSFLLKVLAAASPLSLQAHPTAAQAAAGFAREEAAGIPIDAPERNYKDAYPKPEIIYALEDGFEALCGFRPVAELHAAIARLVELDAVDPEPDSGPLHHWLAATAPGSSLRQVFEWLISRGEGVPQLLERVVTIARANPAEFPVVTLLADAYPGDPGIAISLMLNHVALKRGEALFLPAGNIHAYLRGIGVELMTASDNVLRGGLTPKHVDVQELLAVLDFEPVAVPYLRPMIEGNVAVLRPPGVGFELFVVSGAATVSLEGPAIVLAEHGSFDVVGQSSATRLDAGRVVYVTPDEGALSFTGDGSAFVAAAG